jgi:hypothetical protein
MVLQRVPEQFPFSKLFRQNNKSMSSVVSSQYGAMTEAEERLIAQLSSQGKLSKSRCKNQKIRHENKILKAKNLLLMCSNFRSIE